MLLCSCFSESQPATIGREQTGSLRMNSVSRLRFTGSSEEGVTARICIEQGEVTVQGSSTYSNPNGALHDFSQVVRAGDCRNFFASLAEVNEARAAQCSTSVPSSVGGETTLYLSIQGMSAVESQYTLNSSIGNAFGEGILSNWQILMHNCSPM